MPIAHLITRAGCRMLRLSAALGLACFAVASLAQAQSFPSKAVRLIVPFPPGGPADVMGRVYADKLGTLWNQPVIVENRAGAAGNIGSELTAKAVPDGHTILLVASSHVINNALYDKLPYHPIRDFTPISQVANYALVLVAHPAVPATTLKELVALAKAQPGKLVPYKGAAPATNDLLAGQGQLMFNNPVSALPHVKSGKLRALAVTGAARSPIAPEIPTVAESGYPGFEASTWYAFLAPAGLPREVLAKLSKDIMAVTQMADVRTRFAGMGVDAIGTTPEQLAAIMQAELEKWSKVIQAGNIKAD